MNINFKSLLCGAAVWLFPQYAAGQCAVTDCLQLGYTSLKSCTGGLKCPFGEYWACPQKQCDTSYLYTCTGANEQLGTDKCGDKYKSCNCASGFEWKDGKCQTKGAVLGECTGYAKNCKIGDILNSDGTCTRNKESGKIPIGVVVYVSSDRKCGQAAALEDTKPSTGGWAEEYVDIPGIKNYLTESEAFTDFKSCENTAAILAQGNENLYPAAWLCHNYAPAKAPETKGKWCLPALGIFNNMMPYEDEFNTAFSKAASLNFGSSWDSDSMYWSSTEKLSENTSSGLVWTWRRYYAFYYRDKRNPQNIRAVIEF